jgi:hypothetical protein
VEAVLKLVHLRRRRFQQTKLERLSPWLKERTV